MRGDWAEKIALNADVQYMTDRKKPNGNSGIPVSKIISKEIPMHLLRNILFLTLLVLAVAACGGTSNTGSQPASTPRLTVEPDAAPIGDEFNLQFSGFKAEEMVRLEIALEETQEVIFQTEVQMNAEGSGLYTYRTAEDQLMGAYVATATGEAGKAEARFEVQPPG
jgi:hypothetical protein